MARTTLRRRLTTSLSARWAAPVAIATCVVGFGALVHAAAQHHVSQKGRAFAPARLDIASGDTVEFVNDDGELIHHAYLENERFSFDSGDQVPGSKTVVAFPKTGSFTVLCGIHPKMKLVVQVR